MKKIALNALVLATSLGLAATAGARPPAAAHGNESAGGDFSYSYVEGGVGELDNNGSALFVNGGLDMAPNWGLVGGVEQGSFDPSVDFSLLEAGVQLHQRQNARLSVEGGLKLVYEHVSGDAYCYPPGLGLGCVSVSDSKTGFILNAGARYELQPRLQLEGDLKYNSNNLVKDGFGVQADLRYYLQPRLSVAGGFTSDTELDGLFISLRYDLR